MKLRKLLLTTLVSLSAYNVLWANTTLSANCDHKSSSGFFSNLNGNGRCPCVPDVNTSGTDDLAQNFHYKYAWKNSEWKLKRINYFNNDNSTALIFLSKRLLL